VKQRQTIFDYTISFYYNFSKSNIDPRKDDFMLIRVKYHNDKFDYIKPWLLDRLIKANRIQAFCRRPGWVVVGMDKIRGVDAENYQGPERRKREAFNPFALLYLCLVLSYQFHLMESGNTEQDAAFYRQ